MIDNEPIPAHAGAVGGWRLIPIAPDSAPLVPIGKGSDYDDLITSAVYAGEHLHSPYRGDNVIDAASTTIYVRQSVADRLRQAQRLLPNGMKLIVFDGYRSAAVQRALFDQFAAVVSELHPEYTDTQIIAETEPYVAVPSSDPSAPSPHATGGAVDVAIIYDNQMIEFGTPFDHGSERSALRYFEDEAHVVTNADRDARQNRRLLYRVMIAAGMQPYEHEWWHFNAPETQMGAASLGLSDAHFGAASQTCDIKKSSNAQRGILPVAFVEKIAPRV